MLSFGLNLLKREVLSKSPLLSSIRAMETPKSGSSRHTSRLRRTRSTVPKAEAAVATPSPAPSYSAPCRTSTPSSKESASSNPAPPAKENTNDDDDDDYLWYPGTQYEDGPPEIYWRDEASPRTTRAMLRKRTDDAWLAAGESLDEPTPTAKVDSLASKIVPLPQLPTMCKRQVSEVAKENQRKAIEEFEQIYKKMLEDEAAAAAANAEETREASSSCYNDKDMETTIPQKNVEDADQFCDSGDDSFLCRASQIVEKGPVIVPKKDQRASQSEIKYPPAPSTMRTPPVVNPEVKEEEDDPFDDDMDSLLSQIDVSTVPRAQEATAAGPSQSGPKTLLQKPLQKESGFKRRYNSADAGTGTPPLGCKGIASMPRCATSPDSHRPSGLPGGRPLARCTREEIGEEE